MWESLPHLCPGPSPPSASAPTLHHQPYSLLCTISSDTSSSTLPLCSRFPTQIPERDVYTGCSDILTSITLPTHVHPP